MNKIALFSANRGYALLSSRKELIEKFLANGWRVIVATAKDDESQKLVQLGAELEPISFSRGGFTPFSDYAAHQALRCIIEKYSPHLSHFFHAKPVIMGAPIVKDSSKGPSVVVNTITGLGQGLVNGGLIAKLASIGYRKALPKGDVTIFQNRDDRDFFLERGWLRASQARLIIGSGVRLDRFQFVDRSMRSNDAPLVVMLARLLKQKGIPEFVKVAGKVRQKYPSVRFVLAGEEETAHPDSIDVPWLKDSHDVKYVGRLTDVLPLLSESDLFLFPSYYREGVPRVVMEAAATGLPTVGFDVPGVREAVEDGKTGFLVPYRDVDSMTKCVLKLLENKDLRLDMGKEAFELSQASFDIRVVQEAYLHIYRELGVDI